jgi:hypothetical protein
LASVLHGVDIALNVASLIPGPIGAVGSIGSAVFAIARGEYGSAALDLAGVIPGGKIAAVALKEMRAATALKGVAMAGRELRVVEGGVMFSKNLGATGPRASQELLKMMEAHGRTIKIAEEGSEELRYLDHMAAEANVGGPGHTHILLRPNPSRIGAMEEFLHGTQDRLGIIDRLGQDGAEAHVKDFMARHSKLLGL